MPTTEVIKLKNVRLSFPRLFEPKSFRQGQEPRFEATFLLDPSNAEHAAIKKHIKAEATRIAKEHFGEKADLKKILKDNLCYYDGDTKEYDGYAGMWCIATSNKTRPTVVDQKRNPLVAADGKPYAGCFVNATITLWVMDNEFGKRVNANLRGVQFLRDGEPFGVKPVDAEEEFDDLSEDSVGEDFTDASADDDDDFSL